MRSNMIPPCDQSAYQGLEFHRSVAIESDGLKSFARGAKRRMSASADTNPLFPASKTSPGLMFLRPKEILCAEAEDLGCPEGFLNEERKAGGGGEAGIWDCGW